jgi:ABC-type amino acid transport system permease subunit
MALALLAGAVLAVLLARWARRRQARTGQPFPALAAGAALIAGLPLLVFLAAGAPLQLVRPALQGFNLAGGGALTPEFAALLGGLTLYTAAFIAEIVRAGVLAVDRGQVEAAGALGLSRRRALRLVILPAACASSSGTSSPAIPTVRSARTLLSMPSSAAPRTVRSSSCTPTAAAGTPPKPCRKSSTSSASVVLSW